MKYFFKTTAIIALLSSIYSSCFAQFTRQDTLRGSIGPGRDWWDVKYYDLSVVPDYQTKTIRGKNSIRFEWLKQHSAGNYMQIDFQQPMIIDSIIYQRKALAFEKDGNITIIKWPTLDHPQQDDITIYFHGQPRIALNAPWDGGWVWTQDIQGRPWMTVACQGLGASVWYPCKDHQGDEPDNGASLSITVADSLTAIANGKLKNKQSNNNGTTTWQWEVVNPINNYNIVPYIGKYVNWTEIYKGEKGNLACSYWVLDYNLEKSKRQFGRDVKPMLKCFEDWFGPYPFYEDDFKLVESPHLGMEHQSAIAYGNKFQNGYLGSDLSESGWGSKWDYIIIHESGHEWFGNNISSTDMADMWVHEGFTSYSETLFTECQFGKKAANEYVQGLRTKIENNVPVIGPYGVNKEGSGDMYFKGANLLHTIRQVIDDDAKFKQILRGLNKDFSHSTVTSADVEKYMTGKSKKDLSLIFDQYLRTATIPILEWKLVGNKIAYRWGNCVPGFNMPVKLKNGTWLKPVAGWRSVLLKKTGAVLSADDNFYIKIKKV